MTNNEGAKALFDSLHQRLGEVAEVAVLIGETVDKVALEIQEGLEGIEQTLYPEHYVDGDALRSDIPRNVTNVPGFDINKFWDKVVTEQKFWDEIEDQQAKVEVKPDAPEPIAEPTLDEKIAFVADYVLRVNGFKDSIWATEPESIPVETVDSCYAGLKRRITEAEEKEKRAQQRLNNTTEGNRFGNIWS